MPTITVPQAVWDLAQQISGHKNPGSFIRNDILLPWAITVKTQPPGEASLSYPLTDAPKTELDAPANTPVDDQLLRRKTRLDCLDNAFDPDFATAWAWACNEYGGERQLVELLEDKVSQPSGRLTNPRGMIIARWKAATRVPRRG